MKRIVPFALLCASLSFAFEPSTARAAGTRTIVEGPSEFLEGELHGVMLDTNGEIAPADVFANAQELDAFFAWSLAEDADGRLMVGSGDGGRIFRERDGGLEAWAETAALEVLSLLSLDDTVLCGTAPDAVVLEVDEDGTVSPRLDLDQQSVWDLEATTGGSFAVATGPEAHVYIVAAGDEAPSSTHSLPAANATRLLYADDVLWVGTESPAMLYRLEGELDGDPRLLYEAPESEVKALASDGEGGVYVLSVDIPTEATDLSKSHARIVRVSADGSIEPIHEGDERAMAMVVARDGGLLVADAAKRHLVHFDPQGRRSILHSLQDAEPISLLLRRDGRMAMGTGNLASVVQLASSGDGPRHFISRVIESDGLERWGRLWVEPNAAGVRFSVRSGVRKEPDESWSDWSRVLGSGEVPDAAMGTRFQYRIELSDDARVGRVHVAYRERNLAPRVEQVRVEEASNSFALGPTNGSPQPVSQRFEDGLSVEYSLSPQRQELDPEHAAWARGIRSIVYRASDPNDDALRYRIELKSLPDGPWIELVDEWEASVHAWDTRRHRDGDYRIRVSAHDGAANSAASMRSDMRESGPIHVDNTEPDIDELRWNDGELRAKVSDASSPLKDLSWRVDDEPWRLVDPVDGVLDGRSESVRFAPAQSEGQMIWLRAVDAAGNIAIQSLPLPGNE